MLYTGILSGQSSFAGATSQRFAEQRGMLNSGQTPARVELNEHQKQMLKTDNEFGKNSQLYAECDEKNQLLGKSSKGIYSEPQLNSS